MSRPFYGVSHIHVFKPNPIPLPQRWAAALVGLPAASLPVVPGGLVKLAAVGAAASPWDELRGQVFLGSDQFLQGLPQRREDFKEIPRIQRQTIRSELAQIFKDFHQDEAIASAYREYGYRLKEIAEFLGVHYATVSRRLRRGELAKREIVLDCNRPLKKAHLLRCARPPRSNVLLKYAFARRFLARLASGTFLTGLKTGFFNTLARPDSMKNAAPTGRGITVSFKGPRFGL